MASSKKRDGTMILFVYGTLKHGQRNHGLMREARFLGVAVTAPEYTLLDLGPFPGMIEDGTTAVHGELYEVRPGLLAKLDRHEGVPRLYVRSEIQMMDGGGVESYLLVDHDRIMRGIALESGEWKSI